MNFELKTIKVKIKSHLIYFDCSYTPTKYNPVDLLTHQSDLEKPLTTFKLSWITLLSDFNAPAVDWTNNTSWASMQYNHPVNQYDEASENS